MTVGVAVFDFDSTLIQQESMAMFLRAIAGQTYFTGCGVAGFKALGVAPGNRRDRFRAELLNWALAGKSLLQAEQAAERIFTKLDWIAPILDALRQHQAQGHLILVATGSLSIYMPTLLALKDLRVNGLLTTEMVVEGDVITGQMATRSCTGPEKARRVKEWLGEENTPIWGYGNLPYDEAMLKLTDYPTVVPI
ncbi:MAG: HAD-IB family phosphatase [Magnetococcus sp. WYHC-3]